MGSTQLDGIELTADLCAGDNLVVVTDSREDILCETSFLDQLEALGNRIELHAHIGHVFSGLQVKALCAKTVLVIGFALERGGDGPVIVHIRLV